MWNRLIELLDALAGRAQLIARLLEAILHFPIVATVIAVVAIVYTTTFEANNVLGLPALLALLFAGLGALLLDRDAATDDTDGKTGPEAMLILPKWEAQHGMVLIGALVAFVMTADGFHAYEEPENLSLLTCVPGTQWCWTELEWQRLTLFLMADFQAISGAWFCFATGSFGSSGRHSTVNIFLGCAFLLVAATVSGLATINSLVSELLFQNAWKLTENAFMPPIDNFEQVFVFFAVLWAGFTGVYIMRSAGNLKVSRPDE